MNRAETILQSLRDLVRLEAELRMLKAGSTEHRQIQAQIDSLRAPLPTSILGHHDRSKARGKLSIAEVRHGVCGACHLALPHARLFEVVSKPTELNVCDNCGAFIYLADDERAEQHRPDPKQISPEPTIKVKRAKARHRQLTVR
jgi:predicted  nucleic acid-binding Zn-ribbon protein